jgi:hypothetical protein
MRNWRLEWKGALACLLLLGTAACTQESTEPSEPGQVTPGAESDSGPSYSGVSLPSEIRKDAWYTRTDFNGYAYLKLRYRFSSQGAEFQQQFSGGDFLFRKADGSYFSLAYYGQDLLQSPEQAEDLKALGVNLSGDESAVRSELERVAIAKSGDWVTILSQAAIESTENTVSISWAEIDSDLAMFFQCDDQSERLRIEDDGLKLVRLQSDETFYVLD